VHEGSVIVTKNGHPCAALIELTNEMDLEAFLCAYNPRLTAMIDKNAASHREIPFETVEAMVKRPLRRGTRRLHRS
jgi:hypothetical protein